MLSKPIIMKRYEHINNLTNTLWTKNRKKKLLYDKYKNIAYSLN